MSTLSIMQFKNQPFITYLYLYVLNAYLFTMWTSAAENVIIVLFVLSPFQARSIDIVAYCMGPPLYPLLYSWFWKQTFHTIQLVCTWVQLADVALEVFCQVSIKPNKSHALVTLCWDLTQASSNQCQTWPKRHHPYSVRPDPFQQRRWRSAWVCSSWQQWCILHELVRLVL